MLATICPPIVLSASACWTGLLLREQQNARDWWFGALGNPVEADGGFLPSRGPAVARRRRH